MTEAATHAAAAAVAAAEARALQMLRAGASATQVVSVTGIPLEQLRRVANRNRPPALPQPCELERCGRPQTGAGRPRSGWVQVRVTGEPVAVWFCRWACVHRHAALRGLA